MVRKKSRRENWVRDLCPRDCPFNASVGDHVDRYCSFAAYADVLEPGRYTRTEIDPDGNVNYHIWPDCDVYPKYKGLNRVVNETKRRKTVEHQMGLPAEPDVTVTGHKHPAVSKHRRRY